MSASDNPASAPSVERTPPHHIPAAVLRDVRKNGTRAHSLKTADFLGQQETIYISAHLSGAAIRSLSGASVSVSAMVPGMHLAMPHMTAAQARRLAQLLLIAADEADALTWLAVERGDLPSLDVLRGAV